MTSRLKGRRREVAQLRTDLAAWAESRHDVHGVAMVGSYARDAERMASDVDIVILGEDPDALDDASWFRRLRPSAHLLREMDWGPVRERRFRLQSGLVVELGIAPLSWASVPLDTGTLRVLSDGHEIIYDTGLLKLASIALGKGADVRRSHAGYELPAPPR